MSEDGGELNDKELQKIIRALADPPHARVGILAGKSPERKATRDPITGRTSAPRSGNAEIGAAHEYGAPARGLPVRSFLRMPLVTRFDKEVQRSPHLMRKAFEHAVLKGNLTGFIGKLGMLGEAIVREAFQTSGFGTWAKLSERTLTRKTVKSILIESTQLRDSIMSDVVK